MLALRKDNDRNKLLIEGFKGKIRNNVRLSKRCWFQVGGEAEYLVTPNDIPDLQAFMRGLPYDINLTILGVGSNLLIRDGGVDGVVLRLGRGFADIKVLDENRIYVGAAAMDVNVALVANETSISGLEFLIGIPGTIGGALRMNGGAYGSEIADILESAQIVDRDGNLHTLTPEEIGYSYRNSNIAKDSVFVSAILKGRQGDKAEIAQAMDKITSERAITQPINSRTGGSTFKNPEGHKAWQLIDQAGCRGLEIGGAKMSDKHCNFMINTGDATASDLEQLGEEVKKRVKEHSGVDLVWEIQIEGSTI